MKRLHAGRKVGRTIYDGESDDSLIGMMDSRDLAALVVDAVGICQTILAVLDRVEETGGDSAVVFVGGTVHRDLRNTLACLNEEPL